jgi:hypothetical protein
MNTERRDKLADANLAEFVATKTEIASRAGQQANYITFNITAIGVIASLVFSDNADPRLLFLVPIIASVLGLNWIDHAINIGNLGLFVRDEVKPRLVQETAGAPDDVADYERYATQHGARRHIRLFVFGLPVFMVFGGIPFIAWCLPFFLVQAYDMIFVLLATVGGALWLVFLVYWLGVITLRVWAKQAA